MVFQHYNCVINSQPHVKKYPFMLMPYSKITGAGFYIVILILKKAESAM